MEEKIECCNTCRHQHELIKFDYSKGGCEHTLMEGFACTAFINEGVVIWSVGGYDFDMCECYQSKEDNNK